MLFIIFLQNKTKLFFDKNPKRYIPNYGGWCNYAMAKGEEFKIIEVNGVNSEPTHIHQSFHVLWKANRDIFYHMDLIYEISKINKSHGYETVQVKKFVNGIIRNVTL